MTANPSLVVAVAGMHRSGTSLMARFLNDSGIDMGHQLHIDLLTNPYGHYEDEAFLELQRTELARSCGGEDFLVADEFGPTSTFLEGANLLVEEKTALHHDWPWGWKDPRTTLFLPHWLERLPDLKVVAMLRSPRAVLDSLCRRMQAYGSVERKNHFLNVYTHYNEKLEQFRTQHPERTSIVSLEKLVAEPARVIATLSEALGHSLDQSLFKRQYDPTVIAKSRRATVFLNRACLREAQAVHDHLLAWSF